MRTTIEIRPEHRAKLLEIAARRGEKGFSSVIAEAVEEYLKNAGEAESLRTRALGLRGKLRPEEVDGLRREVGRLRSTWR